MSPLTRLTLALSATALLPAAGQAQQTGVAVPLAPGRAAAAPAGEPRIFKPELAIPVGSGTQGSAVRTEAPPAQETTRETAPARRRRVRRDSEEDRPAARRERREQSRQRLRDEESPVRRPRRKRATAALVVEERAPEPVPVRRRIKPQASIQPAPRAATPADDIEAQPLGKLVQQVAPAEAKPPAGPSIPAIGGKLALVLALIGGSAWLWKNGKRFLPRTAQAEPVPAAGDPSQLRLAETLNLAPQQQMHVVAFGSRRFLVSASPQQVAVVAEWENADAAGRREAPPAPPVLETPSAPEAPMPEEAPREKPRDPAQERFAAILRRLQTQRPASLTPAPAAAPPLTSRSLFGGTPAAPEAKHTERRDERSAGAPQNSLFRTASQPTGGNRDV